jgi:hypothetical protein
MKKFWLFCVCFLLLGKLVAQTSIGVRGGKSISRVNFNPALPQTFVDGVEGGVFLRYKNSRHLGLQLELNMSSQGWHVSPAVDSLAHQKELNYIQLPLLTHVQLGGGRFTFVLQAGGFLAYAFSEKDLLEPAGAVIYRQQAFNPWQYGILGAAGPAYRFNFGELQLEARFAQHLSNLLEANFNQTNDIDDSQQQIITFGLQWLYTF